jgi:hypothetical protein
MPRLTAVDLTRVAFGLLRVNPVKSKAADTSLLTNPFAASGEILCTFFENRKALFIVEPARAARRQGRALPKAETVSFECSIRLKVQQDSAAAEPAGGDVPAQMALVSGPASTQQSGGAPLLLEVQATKDRAQPSHGKVGGPKGDRHRRASAAELQESLFRGIQLANGWQQWNAPDGRVYYFHPERNVSQWARPDAAGLDDHVDDGGDGAEDRREMARVLELVCREVLAAKEMEIAHINSKIDKDPRVVKILSILGKASGKRSRRRDLGVDGQQGALKASFFEERPGTFITRRKGERVFVKAAQSADVRSK